MKLGGMCSPPSVVPYRGAVVSQCSVEGVSGMEALSILDVFNYMSWVHSASTGM